MFDFIKKTFKIGDYIHMILSLIIIKMCMIGMYFSFRKLPAFLCCVCCALFTVVVFVINCYMKKDEYSLAKREETKYEFYKLEKYGMTIFLSPGTRFILQEEIEEKIEETLQFWCNIFDIDVVDVLRKLVKGTVIYLKDNKVFVLSDQRVVVGYALEKTKQIYIASSTRDNSLSSVLEKTLDLIKHELSHIIVCNYNEEYCGEQSSHDLFNNSKLGV